MRLLIAEDEEYTREGLIESIPWSDYGITDIMQARDGSEALKISRWFKPDIVITDIKMPKLNGIEFAEKLIKQCPDSKLLFMSGYLDINYLKSAIRLSAVDYIEKPINFTDVENAVKKAIDFINEKRRQSIINAKKNELEMQKLASILRYKNKDKEVIDQICKETGLPINSNYIVVVIWDRDKPASDEENIRKINDFWKRNNRKSICAGMELGEYFAIVESKDRDEKKIQRLCVKFLEQEKSFRIGMGFCVDNLMSVSESYKVALFNINRSFYNNEKTLFTLDDKILNVKNIDQSLYSEFNTIMQNTPKKLDQWMEQLFQKLCEMECYTREHIKNLFFTFARVILQDKPNLIARLDRMYNEDDVEHYIINTTSIFQIKDFMMQLVEEFQAEAEKESGYSKVVSDVIDYIDAHYTEADLGIEDIAEFVHLSSAHLSVLFKQETGVTLKQYIVSYRLELSKKLLANEHYKINEIAELCGYTNANYFAKAFKAATDQSPVEYRKNCGVG